MEIDEPKTKTRKGERDLTSFAFVEDIPQAQKEKIKKFYDEMRLIMGWGIGQTSKNLVLKYGDSLIAFCKALPKK